MTTLARILLLLFVIKKETVADDWWKTAVFYQIYPRSFKDSNGDGIGDLNGIISKIDHLVDLGISALWLSPIYSSPGVDHGYDISDFRTVDPIFGNLADFEKLVQIAHENDLKVILDFVPNHTSDQHVWFNKSMHREPGFEDYYVWTDGNKENGGVPNNWISYFHGSAWEYNTIRKQYYLHQFHKKQPDLNYRSPAVVQEMKNVLKYWLELGVDGFRIDIVPTLFETIGYPDDPPCSSCNCKRSDYCFGYDPFDDNQPRAYCTLSHVNTLDLPETYDMLYQWRRLVDEYGGVLMTEAYPDNPNEQMLYYGNETCDGAHFTFNFWLITQVNAVSTARDFKYIIEKWFSYMPVKYIANWVLGNHDQHRVASRFGKKRVDGLNMLLLTLPGIAVTYNGEEIGMENGEISYEQGQDPQACNGRKNDFSANSRDFERTPFHWDDTENAGFTTGNTTWLPVNRKYRENNLKQQKNAGYKSHYMVYKKMVDFRRNDAFKFGDFRVLALTDTVLGVLRFWKQEQFLLILNFSNQTEIVDFGYFKNLTEDDLLEIVVASTESQRNIGDNVSAADFLSLTPYECLLFNVR